MLFAQTEEIDKIFKNAKVAEDFLNNAIVSLSDYLLMVVNDLTRTDQDFIRNLTKERSKREKHL